MGSLWRSIPVLAFGRGIRHGAGHTCGFVGCCTPASAELAQIPGRVVVPGFALHPSGALLYQPFLAGPAGAAGSRGGIDIFDTQSGALRLRILLAGSC